MIKAVEYGNEPSEYRESFCICYRRIGSGDIYADVCEIIQINRPWPVNFIWYFSSDSLILFYQGLHWSFFSPLLGIIALLVRLKLGSPVLFRQVRSGQIDASGQERMFTLCKFRSMTDERDENGKLLPDKDRMTWFGDVLRRTSLDELPELWNIIRGDMSIIGPRPLLVRDMVFMTDEQRKRHTVRPGLSGLAQINGRNCIMWEDKLDFDLQYVRRITFLEDIKNRPDHNPQGIKDGEHQL